DPQQNDCAFNYYKQFKPSANVVKQPPIKLDCRNAVLWRDNHCFAADRGTEYDWMQFLWYVNTVTSAKSSMAALSSIHMKACGNTKCDSPITWSALRSAAETHYGAASPKYLWFHDAGDAFGVDEDQ